MNGNDNIGIEAPRTRESKKKCTKTSTSPLYSFEKIITTDPIMKLTKNIANKAAKGKGNILLRGESGTGKELFAHSIHSESPLRDGPFITVNCSAIPEHLLESEFFGYEPGAFTGAERKGKIGKFDLANEGTLFLDEIGDMSLPLQAKMLRVLQEGAYYRVGGMEQVNVNVRIIAATHRNLEKMIEEGTFREDLYYRLNVICIEIPPLRQRRSDILTLTKLFIKEFNVLLGTNIDEIDPEAEKLLIEYHWPGNIRQLRNVIERALTLSEHNKIQISDLPDYIRTSVPELTVEHSPYLDNENEYSLVEALNITEREVIKKALKKTHGNKTRAAKILGLSRSVFYEKLAKHRIPRDLYTLREKIN